MNELIKQLAEQAYAVCGKHTNDYNGPTFTEKFAELIVRECAQRVDYWESRQGEHTDDILKHFGVGE